MQEKDVERRVFGKRVAPHYRERVGAYIVGCDEEGRAGLVKTPRLLLLLGGGVEEGETDVQAISREALEECGVEVEVGELGAIAEKYVFHAGLGEHVHFIARVYTGKILSQIAEPTEKHHKLVYMHKEEAQKKMFFDHQAWALGVVLEKLEAKRAAE